MIKQRLSIVVTVLFLMGYCNISFAELESEDLPNRTGFKLGRALLHAAFNTQEELETNIFLAPKGRFDSITLLNPSVGIEVPFRKNRISVDYDAGMFLYGRFKTENHLDQRIRGLAELNFTDYKLSLKDVYRDFTDRAADENSRRIQRKINTLRGGVKAEFGRLAFDLGYTNLIEAYGQKDDTVYNSITYGDRDRMSHILDLTGSYRFMAKTSASARMRN